MLSTPSPSPHLSPTKRVFRPREAALYLGVSRITVYRWEAAGLLARRRQMGRRSVGWLREDLDAFLDRKNA